MSNTAYLSQNKSVLCFKLATVSPLQRMHLGNPPCFLFSCAAYSAANTGGRCTRTRCSHKFVWLLNNNLLKGKNCFFLSLFLSTDVVVLKPSLLELVPIVFCCFVSFSDSAFLCQSPIAAILR